MVGFGIRMILRSLSRRFRRSAVTFAGVAFAVAVLVVLEALMVGVCDTMVRSSVAIHTGHVHASWQGGATLDEMEKAVGRIPDVRTALWRKRCEGTLRHGERLTGIALYAVQPDRERAESVIPRKVFKGAYLESPRQAVIGSAAAERLGVGLGDAVEFQPVQGTAARFQVGGIFRTGIDGLDRNTLYVRFDDLPGEANELALYLENPSADVEAARVLRAALPATATVVTWREALPEVVQLIALDAVCMHIVLALALLILAFGVSNTVFVSVSERTREFGILKAMGVPPWQIVGGVLLETLLLVSAAGLVGMVFGAALTIVWSRIGLDLGAWTSANRNFIASGVIYPRLTLAGLGLPVIVAAACALLAGFLPARRAGRINVVQALRSL